MEKNRCIVVDDEPAAHYVLVNYIERSADLELVAQCYNAFEALEYLRNNRVDLIFLDIDMPEITGMEFLKMLDNPPKTIDQHGFWCFMQDGSMQFVLDLREHSEITEKCLKD